jgi:hypothetical protein
MKIPTRFFLWAVGCGLLTLTALPSFAACSKINLTRCLDSACAINIGANLAARCQLCGSSSAGEFKMNGAQLSVGASAKNTISEKELKSAPNEPGARYAWATEQCIAKIAECKPDDVSDAYDKLIEQSCKAAGVAAQLNSASTKLAAKKTKDICANEIQACVLKTDNCGADFAKCKDNSAFDKIFAVCNVEASGCDEFAKSSKDTIAARRDNLQKNSEASFAAALKSIASARENKIANAKSACANDAARNQCVATVCANHMSGKCSGANANMENSMATQLCKFHDNACLKLK